MTTKTTSIKPCRAANPHACPYHGQVKNLESQLDAAAAAKDFGTYESLRSSLGSIRDGVDSDGEIAGLISWGIEHKELANLVKESTDEELHLAVATWAYPEDGTLKQRGTFGRALRELATNPATSPAVLSALANRADDHVAEEVLLNPSVSRETFDALRDRSAFFAERASLNPAYGNPDAYRAEQEAAALKRAALIAEQSKQEEADGYKMWHKAPDGTGTSEPITNIRASYGDDVFAHPERYTAFPHKETFEQFKKASTDPNSTIRIYRALPSAHSAINHGDWVAISKEYAEVHKKTQGDSSWHIISMDVPATSIYTEGNDLAEWGYVEQ